jgi:hypothetical protein
MANQRQRPETFKIPSKESRGRALFLSVIDERFTVRDNRTSQDLPRTPPETGGSDL